MKIFGGEASRRTFRVPVAKHLRPLTGMIRRSVFDTLGSVVVDARVLDLYAGSGSFGLEALSRGAASVTFVEHDRRLCQAITQHVEGLGWQGRGMVMSHEVERAVPRLAGSGEAFDVIFCDPPFAAPPEPDMLGEVGRLVEKSGLLLLRLHVKHTPVPILSGLTHGRQVRYGESLVLWYKKTI